MRLIAVPALLLICAACGAPPAHEQVVIDYVEATRKGECERAFALLSAKTQSALRAEELAQREESRFRVESRGPLLALYCAAGRFDRVKLRKTRTAWRRGARAEVHLIEAVPAGHLVPGFWPTRTELEAIPQLVVLEGGEWRIEERSVLRELEFRARQRRELDESIRKMEEWNRRHGGPLPIPRRRP